MIHDEETIQDTVRRIRNALPSNLTAHFHHETAGGQMMIAIHSGDASLHNAREAKRIAGYVKLSDGTFRSNGLVDHPWVCVAEIDYDGWLETTYAMPIENLGTLVRIQTQQKNSDGSYALAEAITFVPGSKVVKGVIESMQP